MDSAEKFFSVSQIVFWDLTLYKTRHSSIYEYLNSVMQCKWISKYSKST